MTDTCPTCSFPSRQTKNLICQTCGLNFSTSPPQRIQLKIGIYRHYKNHLYQVIGLAHDANYEGRVCVIYIGLELDEAHVGFRLAVRSLTDFVAWVEDRDNQLVQRFVYLGPELTREMFS